MSFLSRAPRPAAAAAVAAVCFTAGVAAGAMDDRLQVDRAVGHARAMAAQVAENRDALEASLARAEAASAEAASLSAAAPVATASAEVASSADAAARTAELHRIALESPALSWELPVPLAADGSAPEVPRSVLAQPDAPADPAAGDDDPEPVQEAVAEVVDDADVRQVLDGEVGSADEAQEAARLLESVAADLVDAARELDRTTAQLERATAEVALDRDRATLDERITGAREAVAAAREDTSKVADQILDPDVADRVIAAAEDLETVLDVEPLPEDDETVARLSTDLAAARRTLEDATDALASTHRGWVIQENARRAGVNAERREVHAAAVSAAEDARTEAYRRAVAAHQEGWSGTPAGMTYGNGRLPASELCPLPFAPEAQLGCDAAIALTAADAAYHAQTGRHLEVLSSYRSYAAQVSTRAARSGLAATPGTSIHGWGMAVDLDAASSAWLRAYGADYGWVHPTWARPGGAKPESWHLEFVAPGVGQLDVPPLDLLSPVTSALGS